MAWVPPGENFPLGLQKATFSLCTHMASALYEREKERKRRKSLLCGVHYSKDTNPSPTFMASSKLITSGRPHLHIPPRGALGLQDMNHSAGHD